MLNGLFPNYLPSLSSLVPAIGKHVPIFPYLLVLFDFLLLCHYTYYGKTSVQFYRLLYVFMVNYVVYCTYHNAGASTELYYISGDCALIPRQSTNCNQKHGGFWPNLRHFDVTVSLFSCRTPLTRYLSGKNLSMSGGQWMAP